MNSARRAVMRWAVRMFRREWRQQIAIIALLTFAVAGAIYSSTAVYHLVPKYDGAFGRAGQRISFAADDPQLDANIEIARKLYGTIEVVTSRLAAVPGSVDPVEIRTQDPAGVFAAPTLVLLRGRYPTAPNEIAITEDLARTLDARVDSTVVLGRETLGVAGLVENPLDLGDNFALGFAPPADPSARVVVLVASRDGREGPRRTGILRPVAVEIMGGSERSLAAVSVLALATIVMLLVCLIAAAGFIVVAQRRLRQLGMLGAIGATDRHLRFVMIANGLLVGAVAAIAGLVLGVGVWLLSANSLEGVADHRIDPWEVPPWVVALGALLAVAAATGAAWWPARSITEIPITMALSARRPRPKPARRSALAGVALLVAGFLCVTFGVDATKDSANPFLMIGGPIALVLGLAFISPLAIRLLARGASRLPVGARLAVRDLVRHQARSGAALAAISLGLAIAVTVVVIAAANQPPKSAGNLSDRQLVVHLAERNDPVIAVRPAADFDRARSAVTAIAAAVDASVLQLSAVAGGPPEKHGIVLGRADSGGVRPMVSIGRPVGDVYRDAGRLYVATPEVLSHLGIDGSKIPPSAEVVTSETGRLFYVNVADPSLRDAPIVVHRVEPPAYSSGPVSLIVPQAAARHGWEQIPAGWFLEAPRALTDAQITAARDAAAEAGITIETRANKGSLTTTRNVATGVGMLLALGILAMTVGLIRSEAGRDLRTLAAAGAGAVTRRTLTGVTAGTLALLGVILGIAGAYFALFAGYLDKLEPLGRVPLRHLLLTLFGLPLLATAAGWLLGGREPPMMARAALD